MPPLQKTHLLIYVRFYAAPQSKYFRIKIDLTASKSKIEVIWFI